MKTRAATPKKAAGPKPRTLPKRAVRVCAEGHRQSQRWKPADGCTKCATERDAVRRAANAVEERRRWQEELGPAPAELTIACGDGGLVVFSAVPGRRRRRGRPR